MRIAFIIAMEEETVHLKSQLANARTQFLANQPITTGVLAGIEVVLMQCAIGKTHAAMGAALLIDKFNPSYLINIGAAGGFKNRVAVGDVVVASEVRYHDVDLTGFGYEYGQMAKMPASYHADQTLVAHLLQYTHHEFTTRAGLVVSGDSFASKDHHITFITQQFPQCHAIDMEVGAIAQVCHILNTPLLSIKAISDWVDSPSNEKMFTEHLQLAVSRASDAALRLLPHLAEN